jgi:hypothetical protein
MKKLLCFLSVTGWLYTTATAQSEEKENKTQLAGRNNIISAGINVPVGEFSSTHVLVLGLNIHGEPSFWPH